MLTLRRMHLYLGCFFAPLLLCFSITGAWQTFLRHRETKSGDYRPPALVRALSEVHMNQRFPTEKVQPASSAPFRWLALLLAVGLTTTTGLGIVMAFKFSRRKWLVSVCLLAGFLLPVFLLFVARGFR